jgi:hypothetical protein
MNWRYIFPKLTKWYLVNVENEGRGKIARVLVEGGEGMPELVLRKGGI